MYEALSVEDKAKADEAKGTPAEENEQALRDAASDGDTAGVRVLLAAGTDPDAADEHGDTALHKAAWEGHEEAVGALAEGGADLDKARNDGATPLMIAAYWGYSGVVRRLLELGADHTAVGTGDRYEGKTALEVAEAEDAFDSEAMKQGKGEAAAVLRAWAASQRLAFAGGSHARLGADSPLWPVPLDVLSLVAEAWRYMPRTKRCRPP